MTLLEILELLDRALLRQSQSLRLHPLVRLQHSEVVARFRRSDTDLTLNKVVSHRALFAVRVDLALLLLHRSHTKSNSASNEMPLVAVKTPEYV